MKTAPFMVPFFWDGNQISGIIDTVQRLYEVLDHYSIDELCNAKMAQMSDINGLPEQYHYGAMDVRNGRLASFGYRREHSSKVCLEDWAYLQGMNLRDIARHRPEPN